MGGAAAADMPAAALSVSGTMASIIWARLKRLFGRR
jgi:hypothetical protein